MLPGDFRLASFARGSILRGAFNYLGMQVGWFACVLGAARGLPWVGPVVAGIYLVVHLLSSSNRARELRFILTVGAIGMGVDSVKKASGLLTYASPLPPSEWLAPLWITAMWLLFATTLNSSLKWLQGRYWLAALMGAIFGPLSYMAGERMGAIAFNYDVRFTVVVLALVWAGVVPALAWLAARMTGGEGEE
jgi:hypothetical protein